jgi:hypothetical protein
MDPAIAEAGLRRAILGGVAAATLCVSPALAQSPPGAPEPSRPVPEAAPPAAPAEDPTPSWELGLSGGLYLIPDDEDFAQPTFRADRGRLHLEARYNYEDRDSVAFFAGANFEIGKKLKLSLTPMIGGLVGRTDAIVPGLELDASFWRLEAYGEAEYVFDLEDASSKFFYMWSELSLWPTEWLRAGMVTQRTRVYETERDIQRGALVGFSYRKVEGTVYFFNPFDEDHFVVVSLGVSF